MIKIFGLIQLFPQFVEIFFITYLIFQFISLIFTIKIFQIKQILHFASLYYFNIFLRLQRIYLLLIFYYGFGLLNFFLTKINKNKKKFYFYYFLFFFSLVNIMVLDFFYFKYLNNLIFVYLFNLIYLGQIGFILINYYLNKKSLDLFNLNFFICIIIFIINLFEFNLLINFTNLKFNLLIIFFLNNIILMFIFLINKDKILNLIKNNSFILYLFILFIFFFCLIQINLNLILFLILNRLNLISIIFFILNFLLFNKKFSIKKIILIYLINLILSIFYLNLILNLIQLIIELLIELNLNMWQEDNINPEDISSEIEESDFEDEPPYDYSSLMEEPDYEPDYVFNQWEYEKKEFGEVDSVHEMSGTEYNHSATDSESEPEPEPDSESESDLEELKQPSEFIQLVEQETGGIFPPNYTKPLYYNMAELSVKGKGKNFNHFVPRFLAKNLYQRYYGARPYIDLKVQKENNLIGNFENYLTYDPTLNQLQNYLINYNILTEPVDSFDNNIIKILENNVHPIYKLMYDRTDIFNKGVQRYFNDTNFSCLDLDILLIKISPDSEDLQNLLNLQKLDHLYKKERQTLTENVLLIMDRIWELGELGSEWKDITTQINYYHLKTVQLLTAFDTMKDFQERYFYSLIYQKIDQLETNLQPTEVIKPSKQEIDSDIFSKKKKFVPQKENLEQDVVKQVDSLKKEIILKDRRIEILHDDILTKEKQIQRLNRRIIHKDKDIKLLNFQSRQFHQKHEMFKHTAKYNNAVNLAVKNHNTMEQYNKLKQEFEQLQNEFELLEQENKKLRARNRQLKIVIGGAIVGGVAAGSYYYFTKN